MGVWSGGRWGGGLFGGGVGARGLDAAGLCASRRVGGRGGVRGLRGTRAFAAGGGGRDLVSLARRDPARRGGARGRWYFLWRPGTGAGVLAPVRRGFGVGGEGPCRRPGGAADIAWPVGGGSRRRGAGGGRGGGRIPQGGRAMTR